MLWVDSYFLLHFFAAKNGQDRGMVKCYRAAALRDVSFGSDLSICLGQQYVGQQVQG
jgi:hypothetical protein